MLTCRDKMFKSDDDVSTVFEITDGKRRAVVQQLDQLAMKIIEGDVDLVSATESIDNPERAFEPVGVGWGVPVTKLEVEYRED